MRMANVEESVVQSEAGAISSEDKTSVTTKRRRRIGRRVKRRQYGRWSTIGRRRQELCGDIDSSHPRPRSAIQRKRAVRVNGAIAMSRAMSKIAKFRDFLMVRIVTDPILDCLEAKAILSIEEVDEVKSRSTTLQERQRLLDFIIEKDNEEGFINALRDANQQHFANYLLNDGVRSRNILEDWPLEDARIRMLCVNSGSLKDIIDMGGDLVYRLLTRGVIRHRQQQLICCNVTDSEKNDVFLDNLFRGSTGDYEKAIQCLRDCNQGLIAEILEKGGALLQVHAVLQEPSPEDSLAERITYLLHDMPIEDFDRIFVMARDKLIAFNGKPNSHSIVFYYYLKTLQSWQEMKNTMQAGTMKRKLEELFKRLDSQTNVIIAEIHIPEDDLENIDRYFTSKELEDSVPEFIVGTCRILPKTKTNVFDFTFSERSIPYYEIFCGSSMEFFIQPLHSCIDDIDCLSVKRYLLAFTDEKPILPYDVRQWSDTIDCCFMEPYPDYPSFVRLRLFGQMRYNWERKIFVYNQVHFQRFLTKPKLDDDSDSDDDDGRWCEVGPANKMRLFEIGSFSLDAVTSIWSPQWPNEAKKWPNRQRKYEWPTTAIIQEVVQNGCHVVHAKHPACRNDIHQFRLSFSVAEVILLQSWTQVQQIVYHMLRFFAKRELIRKNCPKEDEVLCTYHFKTLMLWSCERMSPEWWNSSSVFELCCNSLKKLAKWLTQTRCPNYFIPQANLFNRDFNKKIVDETTSRLIKFCDTDILCRWFGDRYIRPNYLAVPKARHICEDLLRCLHKRMFDTCESMKADKPKSIDLYFSIRFSYDLEEARQTVKLQNGFRFAFFDDFKLSLRITSIFEDKLAFLPSSELESRYWLYGSMLRIMHAVHLLDSKEMHYDSEWFLKLIRRVSIKPKRFLSKGHSLPRPFNTGSDRSQIQFIQAQDLMENLTGSNYDPEFQVVSKISKELLSKALECEDSETKTVAQATLSYLAALHFAASEYQIVLELCSRLIVNEKPEKDYTETLNAGCLLFIEDISKIIGFYLIFLKTKDATLHYTRRQFFLDLRLTPEVFVHYLTISSIERTALAFGPKNTSHTPTFPLDAILMTIANRKCSAILQNSDTGNVTHMYQRTDTINKLGASNKGCLSKEDEIIQLLKEYSLGNMTSFFNAVYKDFGIRCNAVDCYRAAYLYQCRKYSEVLHLCKRILDEPDLQKNLKEFTFANVLVLPPLDSYFDKDVQCLLGFQTLVFYISPSNEAFRNIEIDDMSMFQHHFGRHIYSEKSVLAKVVLLRPYSIKCHYYLRKHFMARYLKVRWLIDCNHSLSDILLEFKKLKACLPFEHIIRCFLEQKLRQLEKVVDVRAKEPIQKSI